MMKQPQSKTDQH